MFIINQEMLDTVEREKRVRLNPARNATILRHPTLGDFELHHLPVGSNDSELEERIIQHLAAAAAMGRARHIARREASRGRSSSHGRPHFLVFSSHANDGDPASFSEAQAGESDHDSTVLEPDLSSISGDQVSASSSGTVHLFNRRRALFAENRNLTRPEPSSQDGARPSELQSKETENEILQNKLNEQVEMPVEQTDACGTRGRDGGGQHQFRS